MLSQCSQQTIIVNVPKRPRAYPMGVLVNLITEREMKRAVARGKYVQRVVLERVDNQWRVLVFLKGHTDANTLVRTRSGLRTWSKMENALKFVEREMPLLSLSEIDVYLRQFSEPSPAESSVQDSLAS